MFRQTLLLVCLIALASSVSVGNRVEGDDIISIHTVVTLETELSTNHTINMLFDGVDDTFTYASFLVVEVSLYNFLYFN